MSEGRLGVGLRECGCTHLFNGLCVHQWAAAHRLKGMLLSAVERELDDLKQEVGGMADWRCPGCGEPVTWGETGIVIEGNGRGRVYHHLHCFERHLNELRGARDEAKGERGKDGADEPQAEAAAREG